MSVSFKQVYPYRYQRFPKRCRTGRRFMRYLGGIHVRFVKQRDGWYWFTLAYPTQGKLQGPFATRQGSVRNAAFVCGYLGR